MAWALSGTLNGSPFDTDTVGWRLAINYGRRDTTSQPQPAQLNLRVFTDDPSTADLWQLGAVVELWVTVTSYAARRVYRGTVTDAEWDGHTLSVICVSNGLGNLNRTIVDWPGTDPGPGGGTFEGTVWELIDAGQTAGGAPDWLNPFSGTLGDQSLTTIATPANPALNVGQFLTALTASEPNGYVAEDFANFGQTDPRFAISAYHWRSETQAAFVPSLDLTGTPAAILNNWKAAKHVADLVNQCAAGWTDGTATYADATSIAANGVYGQSLSTYVNNLADAQYVAAHTVKRNLDPLWRVGSLAVDCDALTNLQLVELVSFYTGGYIEIPALWSGAQTKYWVEGWVDNIGYTSGRKMWVRDFYISDWVSTVAAERWNEVTPTLAWDSVSGTLTWNDMETTVI